MVTNLMSRLPSTTAYPSRFTWLKLFADRLLPAGLERALYLDSDMLVLADLTELLSTPLQGA